MKKIGVLSDLHLEASNLEIINPGWDILILAGDISSDYDSLDNFFYYQCPKDIPVIYVLGNHEFEGRKKEQVIPKIQEIISPYSNIHLLNNQSVIIDNTKFIGTTLWSNFEGSGIIHKEEIKNWAKTSIVDFSKIYINENSQYRKITPDDMEKDFQKAYDFLEYELKNNPFSGQKIVVTHFAPHQNSVAEKYQNNIMNAYWVNHLENLLGFSDYWIHGHTHNSFDYHVEGTQVICNPRGYSHFYNLSQNKNFDVEKTIILDNPEETNDSKKKIKP